MNKFFNALTTNDMYTENGMPTHSHSGNDVLNMFFKMGGSRNMGENEIVSVFEAALKDSPVLALKCMFYNRDIRGGQGERRSFRVMFEYLSRKHPELARALLVLVAEFGRWDDVLVALENIPEDVSELLWKAVNSEDSAMARKWMPRENKKDGKIAKKIAKLWGVTPRQYRKIIATNDETVENLMCGNLWEDVNYNHVPSVASKKYRKAFFRHDEQGYSTWLESLEKEDGSAKINAGAIFPHDIVSNYLRGYEKSTLDRTLEAQWKALPDYVGDGLSFVPVVDVSGSMNGLPMEVAVSLGIYLSERNKSTFKDGFITFSERPQFQYLTGSELCSKVNQLHTADWDMNTDLEAVFKLVLEKAIGANLVQEDMPSHIIILSDMQFDQCVENSGDNVYQMASRMYENAGYALPQLVFWNLNSGGGFPVKFDQHGTCLVSGFSPSIMQSLMAGELDPMSMMLSVLDGERYSLVDECLS